MAFVKQGELLQELLQAEHFPHVLKTVFVGSDTRLSMERVDKRVCNGLVLTTLHKCPQFFRLKNRILACGLLEDAMHLA